MLKKMKQVISMFLLGAIVISLLQVQALAAWSAPTAGTDWVPLDRTGLQARFAVGSDIHIGYGYNCPEKFENALKVFKTIDPGIDGIMLAGDLTGSGLSDQYDQLLDIADKSGLGNKIIWGMGNHEYYGYSTTSAAIEMFKTKTGQEPDKVTSPGGITVITLGTKSNDGGDYSEQYDFLKKALEDSVAQDQNKPIFVIAHHGIKGTAYTTDEWYGNYGEGTDQDMVALMAKYPQVIHISGHSHATIEVPTSIDQSKGFTCIQDATLAAYFENETGKIVSDGKHSTYPENYTEASEALLIDVDTNNKVIIRRMNLTTGKYVYEPWTINIPELVAQKNYDYTGDRAKNSKAPSFADGAKVTVDNAGANSVAFSFNQATAADALNDDMIHSYKMKVTDVKTGNAIGDTAYGRDYYLRFADYYRSTTESALSATISGLTPDTEYKAEVWALTAYNVESSNSISTTFTTKHETNVLTASSDLITTKPVIDGDFKDSVWSVGKKITNDMTKNSAHSANFDVKYDYDNVYIAIQVKGDTDLAAGTAWSKGDIAWIYFDPTLHASSPYTDGDWQIGIGYNPTDNLKPYIIMGGGVTAGSDVKTALSQSISAATVATSDGWNVEVAIPWSKLGIDAKAKYQLGFDISVDNYVKGKDLQAITWSNSNWNDTSGFGKLVLSNKNILDVDFSDGTAKDKFPAAHTAVIKGSPVIADNGDLGKKAASFDGDDDAYAYNLTAADYENIKNSFTMECMLKLNKFGNSDPFMNCDGAGLGFELNSDGKTLEFWAHINGKYVVPAADISDIRSKWVHAAVTYDGTALKLYINGELKASEAASGSLDIPGDSAKWLMIGSDTDSSGNVQLPAACDISNARLFGKAMDSAEIASLYAKDNPVVITLSNNDTLTGVAGQAIAIPTATARNANGSCEVSISAAGPDGGNVVISNNTITPAAAGTYTITYTSQGQKLTKLITVTSANQNSGNNNNGNNNSNSGNSNNSGNNSNNTPQKTPSSSNATNSASNNDTGKQVKAFKDMESHKWAETAVKELAARGIVNGTSENTFSPGSTITRADFIVMLVKALGLKADFKSNFADVDSSSYYYEAVGIAKMLGITGGTGKGTFYPEEAISRQDMMVLVSKALKAAGINPETNSTIKLNGFKDAADVSEYARKAVQELIDKEIIKGSGNNISPRSNLTRAEAAVVIYKILK
jgi:hypothetical protein